MKKISRLIGIMIAMVLAVSMSLTAFAQNVTVGSGGGSITITNAAKGETYKIYKLFDASVTGTSGGSIVYTGDIPESLSAYFTKDANGYITKTTGVEDSALVDAVSDWANAQGEGAETSSAVSDGTALVFTGLAYGYYAITSTQGTESVVSIVSTNPAASVLDKNTTEPNIVKSVNDDDVYIGQTVTYTVTANTANYLGEGSNQKKVVQYIIEDTLPSFLTDVTVTSIKVGNTELTVQQFDTNKQITINWTDESGNHRYGNGDDIVITYTAKVTSSATVDGDGNTNTVTLRPQVGDTPDKPTPWTKTWDDKETIKTYAAALQKVDENGAALAGATFYVNGLFVEGTDGDYTVTSYDATSTDKGTVMSTDSQGNLIIKGLNSDAVLNVFEDAAPAGYNKLTGSEELVPHIISETVTSSKTTVYYDSEGNVTDQVTNNKSVTISYNSKLEALKLKIENKKGNPLPSTGGIGTTIFYVIGGLMVLGAAVVLVSRRRISVR